MEPEHPNAAQEPLADAALVARVRLGETHAFELLVRRHLAAAHQVARAALGRDRDEADDPVQEAFITALVRIDQCRDPTKFRSWLLMIVRNRSHNRRDYLAVRRYTALEDVESHAVADDDTGRAVEESELRRQLDAAMTRLTDLQREVFRRHDLEGWDHAEIAEALGISKVGSRYHLHVARRALRRNLIQLGFFGPEGKRI